MFRPSNYPENLLFNAMVFQADVRIAVGGTVAFGIVAYAHYEETL